MSIFRSPKDQRTFLALLMTYTLDLVGFSIVFPVLAPLLLNPHLHFFSAGASEALRTTILGLIFAAFGIMQFIGAPLAGALADHFGRYKIFLGTIGLSIIGYVIMAISIYAESLGALLLGRMVTGLCSGNVSLAQSTTADLTDPKNRSHAFGILIGVGGLGFVVGPWIGGKLANPDWLHGSGAFIFAAIVAFINLLVVIFFFTETFKPHSHHVKVNFLKTFKDIRVVLENRTLRSILISFTFFATGWAFFLVFSPTFLVQRFALQANEIGDIFAYLALVWFFCSMFLNKELVGKFSLRSLILVGFLIASLGVFLFLTPSHLWPYWFIIPIATLGGALSWINGGALLSINASESMQGRAMGANGSAWSFGQIVAPLIAGPLAGWNLYAPLTFGGLLILGAFAYFIANYKEPKSR